MKKFVAIVVGLGLAGIAAIVALFVAVSTSLPKMISLQDYKPLLVSEVFDRNNQKIGEFFREKRMLVPYDKIPKKLIEAFIAAEDSSFFQHEGLNYFAIARAMLANVKAGRKAQGGSTITQQVARSLLLSSEKTYIRKIKEALLALQMEKNLSKPDILYLYLNQIYLGLGAYGVEAAAQVYYRKSVSELTVGECALLAGLPQAPSRYSPIHNPLRAKERQLYVLSRMADEGFITSEEAKKFAAEPVKIFVWQNFKELAPFYLETIRQLLVQKIGEELVLDKGIKIYSSLDLNKQKVAQDQMQEGLRNVDKRQGYRGALKNLDATAAVAEFLLETRNSLIDQISPERILQPDGTIQSKGPLNLTGKAADGKPLPNLPSYIPVGTITKGIVTKVDDTWGLVHVRFAESRGLIDIETMKWARHPDPNVRYDSAQIKKPSDALKMGDVIELKVVGNTFSSSRLNKEISEWKKKNKKATTLPTELPVTAEFANVELEQEPVAEGALVAIDSKTQDVISLVGGYDFNRSQFNRALQALRQTGSSFKSFVYAAALDKNYTPATPLMDVPLVYEEQDKAQGEEGQGDAEAAKRWRPANHGQGYSGEVLFRNALIRSLNIPTVKITDDISVNWVATYAKRLGIFSPLNMDLSLALGSSSVTVYEMTKAFAILSRLGKRVSPLIVHKVVDADGKELVNNMTLDERYPAEISKIEEEFTERRKAVLGESDSETTAAATTPTEPAENPEQAAPPEQKNMAPSKEPPIFFADVEQLIRPQTAFVLTNILQGVIEEPGGTGVAARAIGRPAAGKTGSSSGYFDAWFIGYTPDVATGVWVGYDEEKSLGKGEVGGRAALPIWLNYMKAAHEGLPVRGFNVPDGVVFANIDNETGKLASASSKQVVRQAFIEGTEPQSQPEGNSPVDNQQFYKEDLSD